MPSFRWLVALAVPVVVPAALVAGAATAAADAADDTYLAQLHAAGFSWPPDHARALTAMGCLVAQDIHANLDQRNVTVGDVHTMVSLAHSTYCPNQRCSTEQC